MKLRGSMGQHLWSPSQFFSVWWAPLSNGGAVKPNSVSFAPPILSLYSSYANRLLTFVKIKQRRDEGTEKNIEKERERGGGGGNKIGLRAARKQSSSLLFLLRYALSSISSSFPFSSCYFFSSLCDTRATPTRSSIR